MVTNKFLQLSIKTVFDYIKLFSYDISFKEIIKQYFLNKPFWVCVGAFYLVLQNFLLPFLQEFFCYEKHNKKEDIVKKNDFEEIKLKISNIHDILENNKNKTSNNSNKNNDNNAINIKLYFITLIVMNCLLIILIILIFLLNKIRSNKIKSNKIKL